MTGPQRWQTVCVVEVGPQGRFLHHLKNASRKQAVLLRQTLETTNLVHDRQYLVGAKI
ncbi:hypothetical protein Q31a_35470 [Aureliella helgolandensis]|uniref:Uncharacterized protein n=1 Tax=Aureliella helgolandensis TaxID=2527968 RepID=A0A518G9F0_9BACT|nr:hypothetical protein Q31a_35470 [Aureliella helgolandensis]